MVKRPRRIANRRKSSRVNSAVARISTGVPTTSRRIPPDPPALPHVISYPVRVRFNINARSTVSGAGATTVVLSSTPYSANNIYYDYTASGAIWVNPSVTLSFNELFTAAAMRIFGVDVTADVTSANFVLTDYAIQKIVLYGSDNDQALTRDLVLSVEFGDDIPGFIGRDSGNRMSRPVVGATPPRLSWRKIIQNDSKICANAALNMGTPSYLTEFRSNGALNPTANSYWQCGTLDATVLVRRSFITPPSATVRSTEFSKDEQ